MKDSAHRTPARLVRPEVVFPALSALALLLDVSAHIGWSSFWSWESTLTYSAALVLASLLLIPRRRAWYAPAALLTPPAFYAFARFMWDDWREYSPYGLRAAAGELFLPLVDPLHVFLSAAIFCFAVGRLPGGLRRRVALP